MGPLRQRNELPISTDHGALSQCAFVSRSFCKRKQPIFSVPFNLFGFAQRSVAPSVKAYRQRRFFVIFPSRRAYSNRCVRWSLVDFLFPRRRSHRRPALPKARVIVLSPRVPKGTQMRLAKNNRYHCFPSPLKRQLHLFVFLGLGE